MLLDGIPQFIDESEKHNKNYKSSNSSVGIKNDENRKSFLDKFNDFFK
ncbi:hypothetical protein [Flavobacterium sp. KBS0721]|nr:hypothetical protein [Flavobacterium sp. KBS0721]